VKNAPAREVPQPTIRRLPTYLHYLRDRAASGQAVVSTSAIAQHLGLEATQVRKDLGYTGVAGKPRVGYPLPLLIDAIEALLGWQRLSRACLVGVGHLGTSLLGYERFSHYGLHIVAAFDRDPRQHGRPCSGRTVWPMDRFAQIVRRDDIHIGIVTVPADAAQAVADLMVAAGIAAIWNFAPVTLRLPPGIIVQNEDLYASLALLSQRLVAHVTLQAQDDPHAPHPERGR